MKNPLKAWRERKMQKAYATQLASKQANAATVDVLQRAGVKIHPFVDAGPSKEPQALQVPIVPPEMPKGVIDPDVKLAQDNAMAGVYEYANLYFAGQGFLGFPALMGLTQQGEYRKIVEVLAEEMTRKWIMLQSKGGDDKSERIAQLNDALAEFKLREVFHEVAIHDGFYGRGQIFIDVKKPDGTPATLDDAEMKMPLMIDAAKIPEGSLIRFKVIEPQWTYPGPYNSNEPLAPDFYNPRTWLVMNREISATRLMTFVSRPVPDVLKPAYAFAGLSLTQIMIPYVTNWIRTRDSVSDLVNGFSIGKLKTNLSGILAGGLGQAESARVNLFQKMRNNFGVWALNNGAPEEGGEDFSFENIPLSGLDKLQAQSQEQMASMPGIPLVKLLGITPSGLNASADGEITVFYDHIHAIQERFYRPGLTRAIQVVMLHLWGEVDDDITFIFEPLWQMDEKEASEIRMNDATTAATYVDHQILMPEEVRQAISDDPDNPYHSIDLSVTPEPPEVQDDPAPGEEDTQRAA